jgi:Xaa-Pro dipeptidase
MADHYSIKALEAYASETSLFTKLRTRLISALQSAGAPPKSLIALKGTVEAPINDTDGVYELYYDAFVFNVTGLKDIDYYVLIELDSAIVHVFVSPFNDMLRTFLVPSTPESITSEYGYRAYYKSSLAEVLASLSPSTIYLNKGTNSDSGTTTPTSYLQVDEFQAYSTNESLLYPIFARLRSVKLPEEVEIMRRVIKASSEAHVKNMQFCKPGLPEYSLAGIFRGHISTNYGYIYAFKPISASGNQAAVLHYPFMDQTITASSLVLCDMGAYGFGYSSDIACTFPATGKFTPQQASIYNLVLSANRAVIASMSPGVEWTDMHLLAERVIIEGLVELEVLKGSADELQQKRMGAIFFPHGLGHFLGHDTHDVGGYICGHARSSEPGLKSLRTRRVLEEGMVITVEPGCYFIDFAIDRALNDSETKGFFGARLEEFRGFGGVRIEDDVLVTANGAEILTDVPRTVEEIEAVMAGANWKNGKVC